MARLIGGIVAGLVAAFLGIWLVEMLGHLFYPLPAELSVRNPQSVAAYIAMMPLGAQAFVIAAWLGGALVGAAVAVATSGRDWTGWTIAAVVACAGILNILMIPHPAVMQIGAVAAPLVGGLLGIHLGRRLHRPSGASAPEPQHGEV